MARDFVPITSKPRLWMHCGVWRCASTVRRGLVFKTDIIVDGKGQTLFEAYARWELAMWGRTGLFKNPLRA